jgi:exopolysaccharide biosynthesis predicted pyruvyltransferase EpsI
MNAMIPIHDDADLADPFKLLARTIQEKARGRRVVFIQNAGNFGDGLIRYGTMRFFQDIGLTYSDLDISRRKHRWVIWGRAVADRVLNNHLFIYSGSGAWGDKTGLGHRFVGRLQRLTTNILVLPTTFEYFDLKPQVTAFARDRFESAQVAPNALFCHDMAFYLALLAPDRVLASRTPPRRRLGVMFRRDNERRSDRFLSMAENFDLSDSGHHKSDPQDFLRHIDQFEEVATDRLHVAIGAAILGKRVALVTNNYFKIRAVFDTSLKGRFPKVPLLTSDDDAAAIIARGTIACLPNL